MFLSMCCAAVGGCEPLSPILQLGATVEEGLDFCIVHAPSAVVTAAIDTYDDHRMAMAFSLAACGNSRVIIRDPKCVRKTFPDYFDVLASVTKR
jgi:3-phosphoshikimate 1-carboxyvinyltransferase